MKQLLILAIITIFCYAQTEEMIYCSLVDTADVVNTYGITPDSLHLEIIMPAAVITDISTDESKMLFLDNNGIISKNLNLTCLRV